MNKSDRYYYTSTTYDLFDLIFKLGGKGNPRTELAQAFENRPQKVLDFCVGTASSSLALAIKNDQVHITGIDISGKMLSVAKKKINERGISTIDLIEMPADAMRFESESFDAAMVSFALHEIENNTCREILKEASRVLKKNGKLYIIDFSAQNDWRNRLFMPIWGIFEPKGFSEFLKIDWQTYMEPLGFAMIDKKDFSFSSVYTFYKSG
jgi:ubiquinone/menaquinone biosynthesis C-methylase UbiE